MIGIFKAIRILRQIKNGTFSSRALLGEEASDTATGVLVLPIIIFGVLSALFLLIGFTSFWFGPETFFGILGLLFLIPMFTFIKIKTKIENAIRNHIEDKNQ